MLKGLGYLISTVSVILLGIVAWEATNDDEMLRLALIGGVVSSVLGMFIRWIAHLRTRGQNSG